MPCSTVSFLASSTKSSHISQYKLSSPSTFTLTKYCGSKHNSITAAFPLFYSTKDVDYRIQVFRGCGTVSSILKLKNSWSDTTLEEEGIAVLQNTGCYSPSTTVSLPRSPKSPDTSLWGPQILLCVLRGSTYIK
jgi:hypothetical protein